MTAGEHATDSDLPSEKLADAIDTERQREDGAQPEPFTLADAVSEGKDADRLK